VEIQSRQFRFDRKSVRFLANIDGRKGRVAQAGAAITPAVKESIHLVLHLLKLVQNSPSKWIPARSKHMSSFVGRNWAFRLQLTIVMQIPLRENEQLSCRT